MNIDKMNYVDKAEDVIKNKIKRGAKNNRIELTTNQIRNILELVNELYDMVRTVPEESLTDNVLTHIQYIRMKIVYAAAKDAPVKDLIEKSGLVNELKSVGNSRENLILLCRYTEALVAYHKYYSEEKN